jgi:hypothetical protein
VPNTTEHDATDYPDEHYIKLDIGCYLWLDFRCEFYIWGSSHRRQFDSYGRQCDWGKF